MKLPLFCLLGLVLIPGSASATFVDDFTNGPSGYWNNEIGNWSAPSGTYGAGSPSNFPNASSALAMLNMGDGSIEADVIGASDGGFWLHSGHVPGSAIGRAGVLLVLKNGGVYWHHVFTGASYGSALNPVNGLYTSGGNVHVKVAVTGPVYSVFINGSSTAASTYTTSIFPGGQFALYDLAIGGFDNVVMEGTQRIICNGEVTLGDTTLPAEGRTAEWQIRRPNNSLVDSGTLTLGAGGFFMLEPYQLGGTYELTMKVSHWLRQATAPMSFGDDLLGLQFALTNGDVDEDNEIGPGDFGALSAAFGSVDGDANWNANADLDEDAEVGPSDFGILSANFGLSGD